MRMNMDIDKSEIDTNVFEKSELQEEKFNVMHT